MGSYGVVLGDPDNDVHVAVKGNVGGNNDSYRAELHGLLRMIVLIQTIIPRICSKRTIVIHVDNRAVKDRFMEKKEEFNPVKVTLTLYNA